MVSEAAGLTEDEIVRNMVGRALGEVFDRHRAATDRVVLEARDIQSLWHKGVSFDIKAGEIVGFAGLIGAGRSELAKVIFGELPMTSGQVSIDGRDVHIGQPANAIAVGIGFAPEDRKREGLVLIRSVLENTTMAIMRRLTRFRIMQRRRERQIAICRDLIDAFLREKGIEALAGLPEERSGTWDRGQSDSSNRRLPQA